MTRVLVIDDAAFMRLSLKNMLLNNGFEVVGEAENGAIGIKKYLECKPDIVTLDITMPEMDGLKTLKEIMKIDPKATVVMITAMGQESMVKEAILNGAKSFIIKPFKENYVIKTLKKLS
ncbi:MAG TPA: response regulator [Firmicutes bacterium]|jgi:two-component system chemotaxis response regulator CheY|nr:response regulator [Bacillota bacterium]